MKAFHASNNSAEGMLVSMDYLGIDKVCITSHSSIGPNYRYGNDVVRDAVTRYPDRFMGYVTLNPNYHEDIKNELDRCLAILLYCKLRSGDDLSKGLKVRP